MVALLPERSWYGPDDSVGIEILDLNEAATLEVHHLATPVTTVAIAAGTTRVDLGLLALGGYGLTLRSSGGAVLATSAVDVLADAFDRPRYGFTVQMDAETDTDAVARWFRRNHLNLGQFYDWAYRHSTLMPPADEYLDPLGQPRSLAAVNALAGALEEAGTHPLGYSAVYAIGADEVDAWQDQILYRKDGEPYRLGENFLVLVNPGDPTWLQHYGEQLAQVIAGTKFHGFHLDQYGWPKRAYLRDGSQVDLTEAFVTMLAAIREAVPTSRFMFNNVNDFPTWATAPGPQDASYIEVWEPHTRLQDLAILAERTRRLRPEHPPILSAYLSCFKEDAALALNTARYDMAAIYSSGATHLLLGEDGHALVHPYYPDNVPLAADAQDEFARWYDFLVRYGDLLLDPGVMDVTEYFTGGINEDILVDVEGVRTSTKADAGTLWTRVYRLADGGTVVHLINLTALTDTEWDAVQPAATPLTDVRVRIVPALAEAGIWQASPDAADPSLQALSAEAVAGQEQHDALSAGQEHVAVTVPRIDYWTMLYLPAVGGAA